MQIQRLDSADGPLGEAHGDLLQRLLPAGAGAGLAGGGLLGRRLSLLRRKNSCVSEASTTASCTCAGGGGPEGSCPECSHHGDPLLLESGPREAEPEPAAPAESLAPSIPGSGVEPFTSVAIPGSRGPAPPWLPSPIGEEEETLP